MLEPSDLETMRALPMGDVIKFWDALEKEGAARGSLDGVIRELCQKDLFYLLVLVLEESLAQ